MPPSILADASRLPRVQRCMDHLTAHGRWTAAAVAASASSEEEDRYRWTAPPSDDDASCRMDERISTARAQELLAGHHVVVVGDLAARLWYAALLYLLNGTAAPHEVEDGYPWHRSSPPCVFGTTGQSRGGYDFSGWAHFKKRDPCHRRWYGWRAGTLFNLTLNHTPQSKAWWGRGQPRDVMTLLLHPRDDKLPFTSWELPPSRSHVGGGGSTRLTYLWKGVVRTSGSFKAQHARHVSVVASKVGRPPTLIVLNMGAYDSQWQNAEEVGAVRLGGLFEGMRARWPAAAAGSPLILTTGPASCAGPGKPYSVYMGRGTRHGTFRNLDNASALIPNARRSAASHSVVYVDSSPILASVPPLRTSPCYYDLPIGVMAEALVGTALQGLASSG